MATAVDLPNQTRPVIIMTIYLIIFATLIATASYGWSGEDPETKKQG